MIYSSLMNSPMLFVFLSLLLSFFGANHPAALAQEKQAAPKVNGPIAISDLAKVTPTPKPPLTVHDIDATINAMPGKAVSDEFFSGPYLIFDCRNQTFICVSESGFDACRNMRQTAIKNNKRILDCAPLKLYPNFNACGDAAQDAIDRQVPKNFCYLQRPVPTKPPTPTPTPDPVMPIML